MPGLENGRYAYRFTATLRFATSDRALSLPVSGETRTAHADPDPANHSIRLSFASTFITVS